MIDPERTALMLVDVWANHPNTAWQGYADKVTREKIAPLLAWAQERDIFVIRNFENLEMDIEPALPIGSGEFICDNPVKIAAELEALGIDTILYCGFATNECVIHKKGGIKDMAKRGFDIVIVSDATLGIDRPRYDNQSLESVKRVTAHAVHEIELLYGTSTTLEGLSVI